MWPHTGSWGTPDFGITEGLANLFGQGRTAQGGSNLTGSVQDTAFVPAAGGGFQPMTQPITPTRNTTQNGGGNTGQVAGAFTQTPSQPSQPSAPSYEDQMRGSINAGWDQYTNSLNDMLNVGLPGQRTAQEGIAQESYNQGVNQLGTQKASSEQQVNTQQTRSLKDLTENVKNLFQSGNVYLGARGAGDSSAANQYSYAISKMGTKGRGDILTQANDRMNQIKDIYDSEVSRLGSELTLRKAQISDWFNQAQNQLRSQLGQAGLGREKDIQALSTNLYNQALAEWNRVQSELSNQRSALESWAMSNSKSVGELVNNLKAVGQSMPQFQGINSGMPQVTAEGNFYVPTGYGANQTQRRDLFGNIV